MVFQRILGYFSSEGKAEDYERLLTDLDQQIRVLEVKLMEGRLAERSWGLKLLGGGITGYLGILFYVFILTSQPTPTHLLLVVFFPFAYAPIIYFL